MTDGNDPIKWSARCPAYRETTDFTDLLKVVAGYYEQYDRAVSFIGPYSSRQRGEAVFIPPDREQLKAALGKERAQVPGRARSAFIDALISFLQQTKGRRALITPSPSSHHSAQYPAGTFSLTPVSAAPRLIDVTGSVKVGGVHRLRLEGVDDPLYVEGLKIPTEQIQFIIVRPKLGKLGMPSTSRWEVLFFKRPCGYLLEHVDSSLNPKYSGILN